MPERRHRADARRNTDRIARAAIEALEESGAGVSLDEVARRAGVGIATVYRRFGDRGGLIRAAFLTYFADEVEPLALAARDADDPGQALAAALQATTETLAAHRVLLSAAKESGAFTVDIAERYLSPLGDVLAAAQRRGQIRRDLVIRDIAAVVVMAMATVQLGDPPGADRRRHLALLLAGMRPSDEPLPAPSPRQRPPGYAG
ncbi:TetR/AcrR family transcriptional regulator [Microtetraspora sp. NBRC 13810]|uniref:TetR/AcrR family transcriptional regulator n=1 Tax=Microtetraspora sp. NBRC 13810 TaxID=3030990 RepID=UPI00255290C9|nr:TetR/AcrR family transcriptional regulator [Microtetraspora sp. NBRC 13810]